MNIYECDILRTLYNESFINQRALSESTGHSLGVVNNSLKNLVTSGYLNDRAQLTVKARKEIKRKAPKNAVILAAGYGMRMVPINQEIPKALLEVNGEPLIERLIKQLHNVGVTEIYVVVGFMKEQFEYLIDEYGVELIVNPEYAKKNNLHSLVLALDHFSNTYIVPCDIWCKNNPFAAHELYSWYMVSEHKNEYSDVRVNRKMELVCSKGGNAMLGISFLLKEDAEIVKARVRELAENPKNEEVFWEEALYEENRMIVPARVVNFDEVMEINTYEQLRELDEDSTHLKTDAIDIIAKVFKTNPKDISGIVVLKKGMTNRSFLFSVNGEKYIMRIPGEGTDQLINRKNEAVVYKTICGLGLCDDPVYINPANGYKITKYLEEVRVCDANNIEDLNRVMEKLVGFHQLHLTVPHTFDLFEQIEFYENLWEGKPSMYRDYIATKANVFALKKYIERTRTDWGLTHIDAVPDNFLFYESSEGEDLQLIDWEYAGMQDPHVDIAMFCIYSLYDKSQVDWLINLYFEIAGEECNSFVRAKIYAYIAVCGLLWSNWCEYKAHLGIEFGEYNLRQYRYAKDYCRFAKDLIEEE